MLPSEYFGIIGMVMLARGISPIGGSIMGAIFVCVQIAFTIAGH